MSPPDGGLALSNYCQTLTGSSFVSRERKLQKSQLVKALSLAGRDLPRHPHSTVVASPAFPRTLVENLKERKSRQSCVAMCYPIYLNTLGLGAGSGKKPQA